MSVRLCLCLCPCLLCVGVSVGSGLSVLFTATLLFDPSTTALSIIWKRSLIDRIDVLSEVQDPSGIGEIDWMNA